jgi:hypothetical protein
MLRIMGILAIASVLAACGQTSILTSSSLVTPSATRPQAIVVSDFEFTQDVVLLDRGFAAQLQRKMGNVSQPQLREQLAARVSQEIVRSMVAALNEAALPAREGGEETVVLSESTLLVTGTVRSIDQGNRTRRNVIGFGAGKSEVAADVVVAHLSASGKKEVLTFAAQADSGRRPGAVATAPVSAARGAAVAAASAAGGVASEKLSADVEAGARRLGQAAAHRIIVYAQEQGWILKPGAPGA